MTRMGLSLLVPAVAAIALAVACGGSSEGAPDSFAINGTLELKERLVGSQIGNSCAGEGGYGDIRAGASVVVRNQDNTILGSSQLGPGKATWTQESTYPFCSFQFKVTDLKKASFYSVEVSRRGQITYSFNDLQSKKWQIGLTLGE